MASYFEEHGVKEPKLNPSNQAGSSANVEDFLGLGRHQSEVVNQFFHLANMYARMNHDLGQDGGETEQQELLDNLVTQLLEEATEGYKGPPPASKKFIAQLPKAKGELSKDSNCSICKEGLEGKDNIAELPCEHKFDKDCVVPWLELHNTCPVCRFEVPSDDPEWIKNKEEPIPVENDPYDMFS